MIDTGSDISIIPHTGKDDRPASEFSLYAANNSRISTYGTKRLNINFGLRRAFVWDFCVADVPYPIIGADFLSHFGHLVDLRSSKLIDSVTNLSTYGSIKTVNFCNVSTIDRSIEFANIVNELPEVTNMNGPTTLSNCSTVHHIHTRGFPMAQRARRLPPEKLKIAIAQFKEMTESGLCQPSSSAWAAPILMRKKKDDSWRICGDYRQLNAVAEPDRYPVPYLHGFAANLQGKTIFSKLGLFKAYHQIPVVEEDIPKTTVITPFGLFEFTAMTFGLRNAGQTFQRYIFCALGDLDFVFAYIDDILIASSSREEHEKHLRIVFDRLRKYGLRAKVSKCQFGLTEMQFLGHVIDRQGCRPSPEKVEAIFNWPKPTNRDELRRWLGMVNFYRRSMPHAAHAQAPLHEHLRDARKKDKRKVAWDEKSLAAFEQIKDDLLKVAVLAFPCSNAETRLITDASDTGIGAALEQKINDIWKPLAFFSRKLTPAQQRYSTYDRELTAIYESIKHFRHFVEGREFSVITDHKPLILECPKFRTGLLQDSKGRSLMCHNSQIRFDTFQANKTSSQTHCLDWTRYHCLPNLHWKS